MGGGLGFQNRGFGEGCLATHGVEIDEHAGDVDHGATADLLLLLGASDAGIDELARGRRAHLLAVDEGGLRRGGHVEAQVKSAAMTRMVLRTGESPWSFRRRV